MRRNCNLELRLVTPSAAAGFLSQEYNSPMLDNGSSNEEQQQPLTIFYNGKVAVCDVTEIQARSIIMLANRETEDKSRSSGSGSEPSSPLLQSQLYSPNGVSMKRSLQRFLQKRKNMVQATSPYHH